MIVLNFILKVCGEKGGCIVIMAMGGGIIFRQNGWCAICLIIIKNGKVSLIQLIVPEINPCFYFMAIGDLTGEIKLEAK